MALYPFRLLFMTMENASEHRVVFSESVELFVTSALGAPSVECTAFSSIGDWLC